LTCEAICPRCQSDGTTEAECHDAYARAGVLRAHWECWSECNLRCSFCYRSRAVPLTTDRASNMIRTLAYGGVRQLAFAGGDPSLRPDIRRLVAEASAIGIQTEIQTNGHIARQDFLACLGEADFVGLSIDSASASMHDQVRGRRGNFARVLELADTLDRRGISLIVRTLVSSFTADGLEGLGRLLTPLRGLKRWSLVQFSAIEDGFRNRRLHEISDERFLAVAEACAASYHGRAEINIYSNSDKRGVYFLIGPNGDVYKDVSPLPIEHYAVAGNILELHATDIVRLARTSGRANSARYLVLEDAGGRGRSREFSMLDERRRG
jgi:MoaA/NifB/PqqE/SkfB family radical SAM enzyme